MEQLFSQNEEIVLDNYSCGLMKTIYIKNNSGTLTPMSYFYQPNNVDFYPSDGMVSWEDIYYGVTNQDPRFADFMGMTESQDYGFILARDGNRKATVDRNGVAVPGMVIEMWEETF